MLFLEEYQFFEEIRCLPLLCGDASFTFVAFVPDKCSGDKS